jgi:uncharacterized protein
MLRREKRSILPNATRFINQYRESACGKPLQCRFFYRLMSLCGKTQGPPVMKLHATSTQQYQTVTAYDEKGVEINAAPYRRSLLVMPEMAPVDWPVSSFDALSVDDFAQIGAINPDVVILGTGARQRFIHPSLIAALTARRIGVETMDNPAACRTYNILMAEGRRVALALILDTPAA